MANLVGDISSYSLTGDISGGAVAVNITATGPEGKSAYEVWLELGNTGTKEQFLATLKGERGERGFAGATGPRGLTGSKGEKGNTGATGPAGPQGLPGTTGPMGPRGLQGDPGPKGDTGATGAVGPKGERGPQGLTGPQGERGERGFAGPQGLPGLQGPKGETGEQGPIGPQGPQGEKGDTGEVGPIGPQGGVGPQGPIGPQGEQGPKGDTGPQGPAGDATINDTTASTTSVYSSTKVEELITAAGDATINDTTASTTTVYSSTKVEELIANAGGGGGNETLIGSYTHTENIELEITDVSSPLARIITDMTGIPSGDIIGMLTLKDRDSSNHPYTLGTNTDYVANANWAVVGSICKFRNVSNQGLRPYDSSTGTTLQLISEVNATKVQNLLPYIKFETALSSDPKSMSKVIEFTNLPVYSKYKVVVKGGHQAASVVINDTTLAVNSAANLYGHLELEISPHTGQNLLVNTIINYSYTTNISSNSFSTRPTGHSMVGVPLATTIEVRFTNSIQNGTTVEVYGIE